MIPLPFPVCARLTVTLSHDAGRPAEHSAGRYYYEGVRKSYMITLSRSGVRQEDSFATDVRGGFGPSLVLDTRRAFLRSVHAAQPTGQPHASSGSLKKPRRAAMRRVNPI